MQDKFLHLFGSRHYLFEKLQTVYDASFKDMLEIF